MDTTRHTETDPQLLTEALTEGEVAKLLGKTPKTLRMWRYQNKNLPYWKLPDGSVWYSPHDVDAYLTNHKAKRMAA